MGVVGKNWKSREDIEKMTPSQLVSWFLISSYCYYEVGRSIMSDPSFDYLVKRLKEEWDNTDHPHKELITESHLNATTGYDIDYPTIVRMSGNELLREIKNNLNKS